MELLAQTFSCSIGVVPFTYFCLPLGTTKPKVKDCLPLILKCERRLVTTSTFLSQAGKLQVTNTFFSAIPTLHLCTFKLHKKIIKQIDKYRKHCLWRVDINARKDLDVA
jgi:hypothetical protein